MKTDQHRTRHLRRPLNVCKLSMLLIIVSIFSVSAYKRNAVYDNEMVFWQDIVDKSPRKSRGHDMLGNQFRESGLVERAVKQFSISLEIEPNPKAYNNFGLVYAAQGINEKAIDYYLLALAADPNLIEAHLNLAITYIGMGEIHKARGELETILHLNPNHVQARQFLEYLLINNSNH